MTQTKFVFAKGTEEHPVEGCTTAMLKERSTLDGSITFAAEKRSSRLEDLCKKTVSKLELTILEQESSIQDVDEKLDLDQNSPDHIKELFWGKNWRHYVSQLQNRKRRYEKQISSYKHMISIVEDNMFTDDLDTAADLIELYLRVCDNINESDTKKSTVGDTIFYRFTDLVIEHKTESNSVTGRHAVLQRYNPDA